ncbi:peptidase [Falsochrobactrum shanghaiense]|uniref:ATP-dependent Clp protease proteolytic subunit n=1 Tax=Falsochrobactrum shanghaiense TaxID=2201899 RepID=A0A316JAD3_9HYPH|nr:head maturation protease, ClpP-related [Falsochrobactrum shanghaiense]PWL18832.1 peptidase [Falsochrobactrum shanghaiense]
MNMPRIEVPGGVLARRHNVSARTPETVLDRWDSGVRSADAVGDNVVSIYDVIGEDFWTGGGFTLRRLDGALRQIGRRDFEVHINSPGGDMFEGVAIYNKIRDHAEAHGLSVKVKVLGLAASAASVIAMAGDEIEIGAAASIMIHNCWTVAIGNRNDFAEMAQTMEQFDANMAAVYEARTGNSADDVAAWMNAETWFSGQEAIDAGFATELLPADRVKNDPNARALAQVVRAEKKAERALRMAGASAKDAKTTISDMKKAARDDAAVPDSNADVAPSDYAALAASLTKLTSAMETHYD